LTDENGILAKLVEARKNFLAGFDEAAALFRRRIQELRESYLNQVVDITLTDPRLGDVEKALSFRTSPENAVVEPSTTTKDMIPLAEKWPKKTLKGLACPACGVQIQDLNARFCSQCASPLLEGV
jgi:hypothetical protein